MDKSGISNNSEQHENGKDLSPRRYKSHVDETQDHMVWLFQYRERDTWYHFWQREKTVLLNAKKYFTEYYIPKMKSLWMVIQDMNYDLDSAHAKEHFLPQKHRRASVLERDITNTVIIDRGDHISAIVLAKHVQDDITILRGDHVNPIYIPVGSNLKPTFGEISNQYCMFFIHAKLDKKYGWEEGYEDSLKKTVMNAIEAIEQEQSNYYSHIWLWNSTVVEREKWIRLRSVYEETDDARQMPPKSYYASMFDIGVLADGIEEPDEFKDAW